MTEVTGIDHIYITVSDLVRSEAFYDLVLQNTLGFRKNKFALGGDPHVQYFNRHFGFVPRPARGTGPHNPYSAGLHDFCFRVDSVEDVIAVSNQLRSLGIEASEAMLYPEYAPDYWATFFTDPTVSALRSPITDRSAESAMTTGGLRANIPPQWAAVKLCLPVRSGLRAPVVSHPKRLNIIIRHARTRSGINICPKH